MKEENNKMNISRRGFLKTAALAGAALTMPTGLDKVFAAETKQTAASDNNSDVAHITGHRILGKGKAAFEVSALGFGVMGMTYNRSQHPDKKQCIRLLHEAVDRGVTLFDTAIIYGPLTNENLAGEALAEFKGRINVTTKFGHEVIDGKGTGRQDSRPETIRRYCEESLPTRFASHVLPAPCRPQHPGRRGGIDYCRLDERRQSTTLGHVRSQRRDHPQGSCRLPADGHPKRISSDAPSGGGKRSARRLSGTGNRLCSIQPAESGIFGRLHQRIHGFRPKQRQPTDPAALPSGSNAGEYPHRECAASLRPHTRHDLDTSSTRLVATEGTVDRTDSRNNETCTSGGEPAHTGIYTFSRRVERTGKRCCRHPRCRRQIQCRATTAGRSLKQNTLSLAAKTLQVFAFIFASKKQLKITDMKMKVLF